MAKVSDNISHIPHPLALNNRIFHPHGSDRYALSGFPQLIRLLTGCIFASSRVP
jgi:hypothetical protein